MERICTQEHFSCHNYSDGETEIKAFSVPSGGHMESSFHVVKVVMVLEGSFSVSFEKYIGTVVNAGEVFLLPPRTEFRAQALETTRILSLTMNMKIEFCERYGLDWLSSDVVPERSEVYLLRMNSKLTCYAESLYQYIQEGFACGVFFELKIKEFMMILSHYYRKSELAGFFGPLVNADARFAEFIFENYDKYKTVQELADASCHSLSAFNKIFRKTFGMSPYHWMQQQRARKIYYGINVSNKPMKELSDEFGFSSLSQFSNFCKAQFGYSPRKIKEMSNRSVTPESSHADNEPEKEYENNFII